VNQCQFCVNDNGNYDFSGVCCRVRFLMGQKSASQRLGWITHWSKKLGHEQTEVLKAEFLKQWETRAVKG